MPKKKRQTCFVIMPFSETSKEKEHTKRYWTKHYSSFLKPLIEEQPMLEAHRSQPLRGDIVNQIIKDLLVCQVVVADLTDSNPNVYWELGVRQSFKHGTVTIAEEGTNLPSDIGAKGTLFYSDDHLKDAEFRQQFREALNDCLAYPERPDSRVLELISGRGTLFEIFRSEETMRRLDALLLECRTNAALLKKILNNANRNLKSDSKVSEQVTNVMGQAAIELLLTNRYLDEEAEFYFIATLYLNQITPINTQINAWKGASDNTDKWFIKVGEDTENRIKDFITQIEAIRDVKANGLHK